MFKNKYLKYKNKYNTLKILLEGGDPKSENLPAEIKVLTWNILESALCNENTFYDIFYNIRNTDLKVFDPKNMDLTVKDFNNRREEKLIDIIIEKLKADIIICLQEVCPTFHELLKIRLNGITYFYIYGEGTLIKIKEGINSQQGVLILSLSKFSNSGVLYPFEPKNNNPIAYAETNGVIIINTHYFAGGNPSSETPNEIRDKQTLTINKFINENKNKNIIFCSDFNRYLINYQELFDSKLKLINDITHKPNQSKLYVFSSNNLNLEIINKKIKDLSLIENNDKTVDKQSTYPDVIDENPRNFKNHPAFKLISNDKKFYQDNFYLKVDMKDNCIDGIWTNINTQTWSIQKQHKNPNGSLVLSKHNIRHTWEELGGKPNSNGIIFYPNLIDTPSDHTGIIATIKLK